MPAKSKAQQQMFGIAHAIQQGKRPAGSARSPATDVAKAAKPKDVKDFASTKTKNLPQKVKKEQIERIREYVTKVVREVMSEAYNRGTALISINGRNGHVRWRTSDGQYDEDLPGNRSKEHVQRRVAQIKKKLWGYDIKINDPDGMLKEGKFEFEWYEQGRWLTKIITGTKHDADVMLDKIRDRVRAAGEATGNVSYTKVG